MEISELQLPACLNIPTAFLLQEYPKEHLYTFKDSLHFSFFHWAVIQNNVQKVVELLNFNFNYSICTNSNIIPSSIWNHDNIINDYIIPFNKNGYSPVHLSVFLHKFYDNIENKNSQGNKNNHKHLQKIIILEFLKFDSSIFSLKDKDSYTVLDYCFLSENIELIELALTYNPNMDALNKVKTETALSIIDTINLKNKIKVSEFSPESFLVNPLIEKNLKIKISYDTLNNSLPLKNVIEYKKLRKV